MMDFKNLNTQDIIYLVISAVLIVSVLFGIFLMSKVKKSRLGNGLSALAMLFAIVLVLIYSKVFDFSNDSFLLSIIIIFASLLIGSTIGFILSKKVKMIEMPQLVALLNGLGGAASALVGITSYILSGKSPSFGNDIFTLITSSLAIAVGLITLFGSLVAAGKLHRLLPQKAIVLKGHQILIISLLIIIVATIIVPSILIPLNVIDFILSTNVFILLIIIVQIYSAL